MCAKCNRALLSQRKGIIMPFDNITSFLDTYDISKRHEQETQQTILIAGMSLYFKHNQIQHVM